MRAALAPGDCYNFLGLLGDANGIPPALSFGSGCPVPSRSGPSVTIGVQDTSKTYLGWFACCSSANRTFQITTAEYWGMVEGKIDIEGLTLDDSILVAGPPMTGKYDLFLQILASYTDAVIIISTKNRAARIREDYRPLAGDISDEDIGVIDCVSHNETAGQYNETRITKYVGSPNNMTAIGVKFTELFEAFYERNDLSNVGVGLHSASQLVMHADIKRVYQFLQVLTGQVRSAGWLGVVALDTSIDTDDELRLLQHHFDGIVETKEHNGGRAYRVRGLSPQASDWIPF